MNIHRRVAPFGDSGDSQVIATAGTIAASPDTGQRCAARASDGDFATRHGQAGVCRQGLADGLEHLIGGQAEPLARPLQAGLAHFGIFHLDAPRMDRNRHHVEQQSHAMLRRKILFIAAGRHIIPASPIGDRDRVSAQQF